MGKFKILMVFGLVATLSGCFGGGITTGDKTFTADAGTFNLIFMKINWKLPYDGSFDTQSNALQVAESHVTGTITNVNGCMSPWSSPFPLCLFSWWNQNIIGFSGAQIGGTK